MPVHIPRKRFGQHFLHDQNVIEQIINAIHPEPDQFIVEIGPGQGALTLPLLKRAGNLHVIELDRDLAKLISDRCKNIGTLHMHCTDALKFDFCKLADKHIRVIGNLPYNISTMLIFHLLDQLVCIKDMVFMLQEEVVDRINAEHGTRAYGRLSVMVQSQCQVQKLFRVESGAFSPPPKVESAIVRLIPHATPVAKINNNVAFTIIVRESFNHRRKTLRNALKNHLDAKHIESVGIDPGLRPEQLTICQFASLANLYHPDMDQ